MRATSKPPATLTKKNMITTDDIWKNDPDTIRNFLNIRHEYEQLCAKVEYILKKKISHEGIETSFIGSRAKSLNSFLEKLQRKSYGNPLEDLTDLAGARVVCLYSGDLEKVEQIIRAEFTVVETVNKLAELEVNQFGYGALHFIVKLGKSSSGARYDDLKNFACEIQVRTVVQDAWAIIQHHMAYKKESQIPSKLLRKLNGLAGLFETVDDQFESIRDQRDTYLSSVRESSSKPQVFLDNELNIDSFVEYLKWAFPKQDPGANVVGVVVDALASLDYKKLQDLHDLIESTKEVRKTIIADFGNTVFRDENGLTHSNLEAAIALAVKSPEGQNAIPWGAQWLEIIKQHQLFPDLKKKS